MIENLNTYGGDDTYDDVFLAKLTARTTGTGDLAGVNVYDWEEQSFNPTTGLPVIMSGGRTGTYSTDGQSPALEINDTQIRILPVYVLLRFRCIGDSKTVFEFEAPVVSAVVSASPDCSIQINTCAIPKYAGNVAGVFTLSDTTFTDAVLLPAGGGITVEYQGWCGIITAGTWSSGTATITSAGHPLVAGDVITVHSVSPDAWNVTQAVVTGTATNTIDYAIASDPGAFTTRGVVVAPNAIYCVDNPSECCPVNPCACDDPEVESVRFTFSGRAGIFAELPATVDVPLSVLFECFQQTILYQIYSGTYIWSMTISYSRGADPYYFEIQLLSNNNTVVPQTAFVTPGSGWTDLTSNWPIRLYKDPACTSNPYTTQTAVGTFNDGDGNTLTIAIGATP